MFYFFLLVGGRLIMVNSQAEINQFLESKKGEIMAKKKQNEALKALKEKKGSDEL